MTHICYLILLNLSPVLCPGCCQFHQMAKIDKNQSISSTKKFVIQMLEKTPKIYILFSKSRVQIKCITMAKCDLFFHYRNAKDISFHYLQNFVQNKKTHVNCIYIVGIMKINEWCLIDCFHHEFRVSTQIMVRIIVKNSVTFFYFDFLGFFRKIWISAGYITQSCRNYRF